MHTAVIANVTVGPRRQLVDGTEGITDSDIYDAFGNLLAETGSPTNNYLFNGQQWDANAGSYYLRARYYNSGTGRFLSQDPERGDSDDPITLHRYLYAGDEPVDGVDPGGREPLPEQVQVIDIQANDLVENTSATLRAGGFSRTALRPAASGIILDRRRRSSRIR